MANQAPFVLPYIDDFLAALSSSRRLSHLSKDLQRVLVELGLCLKDSKSTLEPTTRIHQLGLVVDSKDCTFTAPASKLAEICRPGLILLALASRQARLITAKLLARFLGKIAFLGLAIRPAKFYIRNLYLSLATKRLWQLLIRLSRPAIQELQFWTAVPRWFVSMTFQKVPHQVVLATDASL